MRITRVSSRFEVPCFGATVWSPDFAAVCLGWGAHLDPGVAVSRAVTEAVQSRLTVIAGARDDLPEVYHVVRLNAEEPVPAEGSVIAWQEAKNVGPGPFENLSEELAWATAKVTGVTGIEPLCVDLSTVEEFAVVKVFAPDTAFDLDRVHTTR